MKKFLTKTALFAVFATASASLACLTSCGGPNSNDPSIDTSKTQIYVKNYQGGYGNKWLYTAKNKYEALHAEDSYESGKKGVQILISEQKTTPNWSNIKNDVYQVYFFESINYHIGLSENVFEEITDVVTNPNPYEPSKTIESKLYDENKQFLNVVDNNGQSHYYAIPHYSSSFGIVYNKTVFKSRCLYFSQDYKNYEVGDGNRFIFSADDPKSVGMDGLAGTYDDGLPTTYEEFYELCNYMVSGHVIPLVWMGKNGGGDYLPMLINSLTLAHHGAEQMRHNFDYDGSIEVVKLNTNETEILKDTNGYAETEMVTVHPEKVGNKYDGYETQRMTGKYYGLSFLEEIIRNKQKKNSEWACALMQNSSSHLDAQSWFINSQFGRLNSPLNSQKNCPIAMILEGDWWESEASAVIDALPENEKAQLDFGWMPLPKATENSNTRKTSLVNESFQFIKKGLSKNIRNLCADFLAFMNTDETLKNFTTTTNAIRCLNYELSTEEYDSLTKFGQDYWNYYKDSDKVFTESHSNQFMSTVGSQLLSRRFNISKDFSYPQTLFSSNTSLTASKYIAQMYKYYRDYIWTTI